MLAHSPRLQTQDLTVHIGRVEVCRDLNLTLDQGQCCALLGRNGAGKTTLLHTLAGLRRPERGEIRLDGRALTAYDRRRRAQRIGLLPQDADDPFPSSVLETALIGRHPHLAPWRLEGPQDFARARAALTTVGLQELTDRDVATLSGGERRRLALATLLCQEPAVMLLDEPTNHLDLHFQMRTLATIGELTRAARATLMSLHDVNLALRFCSHALLLYGAGEYEFGPIDEVVSCASLARLYHHPMLESGTGAQKLFFPA